MNVYENLNKTLIKDCNETVLSNQQSSDSSDGFVLESIS